MFMELKQESSHSQEEVPIRNCEVSVFANSRELFVTIETAKFRIVFSLEDLETLFNRIHFQVSDAPPTAPVQ